MKNNNTYPFSVYTEIGSRAIQQDDYLINTNLFNDTNPSETVSLYSVLDGHGPNGHLICYIIKQYIEKFFLNKKEQFKKDSTLLINDLFKDVQETLKTEHEKNTLDCYLSGATCLLMIIYKEELLVSNLGDCRAIQILGSKDNLLEINVLTKDHNCENKLEYQRLIEKGARIEKSPNNNSNDSPLRIFKGSMPYPGLAVSRCFGDLSASNIGVISVPQIESFKLKNGIIVIGSDGVFDALDNMQIADYVTRKLLKTKFVKIAKKVVTKCLKELNKKDLSDNITAIVIHINNL